MATTKQVATAKPVRSVLHPALVHLPIALLPVSVLLDVAGFVFSRPELQLVRSAFLCLLAGIGTGLLAAIVGVLDYVDMRDDHPAKKTATLHMILNVIALGLFAVSAGLRYGVLNADRTPPVPFVVSLVAFGLLGFSGYLGGKLVYDDGLAVGRHRRRGSIPQSTLAPRSSDNRVAVADDDALAEGSTLRVQAHGTVLVIARVKGELYAFQEFCTHRYGPLSEGALAGCEIMCPWHRSRFDMRTGRPTAGPAKVDLRTFPVEAKDGKIWVEVRKEKS